MQGLEVRLREQQDAASKRLSHAERRILQERDALLATQDEAGGLREQLAPETRRAARSLRTTLALLLYNP